MTIILVIAAAAVGYLIFVNWQQSSHTIDSANSIIEENVNGTHHTNATNQKPEPVPLETAQADFLWIPDRSIETPIQYVDEATEKVFQEALTKGVVHYPGTALPGEYGNPYIFGHSSDYAWKAGNYKQVLKPLVDIPVGTEVRITNPDGELFIYHVIETKIVGPKDVSVMDQFNYERKLLTLQTSWPVGTALKRYIAVCELDEQATYGTSTNSNTNTAQL